MNALKKTTFFIIFFLLSSLTFAGLFDGKNPFSNASSGPLPVEQAFTFSFSQQGGDIQLSWQIEPDYYLYENRIRLELPEGAEVLSRVSSPAESKNDPLFGKVDVYLLQAQVDYLIKSAQPNITAVVYYQGCWEGGVCYPPVSVEIQLKDLPSQASQPDANLSATPPIEPRVQQVTEQDQFVNTLIQKGLVFSLFAFFLAGLALAFTPCVFPMIPILSSIIAGQDREQLTPQRAFVLSLVYVLAVSLTYTIAGVIAGLFGENLQAAFQNPWILSTFSGLFVILALSMFGFYDLQLPSALQSRLSSLSHSQQGGTFFGVAIMGFLSALIVGPCMAAPLAGALIYIGQAGDPILGGAALFSLSMGMGVPLLLIGTSAGQLLPKAGRWMEGIKAAFGVMLLLLAIWMLDRIVDDFVTLSLTAIVLIVASIYMNAIEPLAPHAHGWNRLWKGIGLIILIYGISLMIGALSGGNSLTQPLAKLAAGGGSYEEQKLSFEVVSTERALEQKLERAREQGTPVLLDFYADWCISCIEIEKKVFSVPQVQSELQPFSRIKVDVTLNDDEAKALYKKYNLIGPPALIFYNKDGEWMKDMTLIGVPESKSFVEHIKRL